MKPTITSLGTGLDDVLTEMETPTREPLRPRAKKLTLRVSGARLGGLARPVGEAVVSGAVAFASPRFGLRVHSSPVGPVASTPLSRDDYATAEDYE